MGLEGSVSSSRLYCVSHSFRMLSFGVLLRVVLLLKGQDFLVTEVSCIRRTKLYTEVKTLSFLFSIKFTHNSDALNKNMHVFWKIANNQIMFT